MAEKSQSRFSGFTISGSSFSDIKTVIKGSGSLTPVRISDTIIRRAKSVIEADYCESVEITRTDIRDS